MAHLNYYRHIHDEPTISTDRPTERPSVQATVQFDYFIFLYILSKTSQYTHKKCLLQNVKRQQQAKKMDKQKILLILIRRCARCYWTNNFELEKFGIGSCSVRDEQTVVVKRV